MHLHSSSTLIRGCFEGKRLCHLQDVARLDSTQDEQGQSTGAAVEGKQCCRRFFPAVGYEAIDPEGTLHLVLLGRGTRFLDKQDVEGLGPQNIVDMLQVLQKKRICI